MVSLPEMVIVVVFINSFPCPYKLEFFRFHCVAMLNE